MINPQANPHMFTQDYFEELLQYRFPASKVNDIIPFHFQGSPAKMENDRSIYYGFWTVRSYGIDRYMMAIVNDSPGLRLPTIVQNPGIPESNPFAQWFGMANFITVVNDYGSVDFIAFHGFRATFDNTPSPPESPIPPPPITLYRIASVVVEQVNPATKAYAVIVTGVPNSTLHCTLDGTNYTGNGGGTWQLTTYPVGSAIANGAITPDLVGNAIPFDIVLDSSGNGGFYAQFTDCTVDFMDEVTGNLVGATSGIPGSPITTGFTMP
jgi:hypothetical protein